MRICFFCKYPFAIGRYLNCLFRTKAHVGDLPLGWKLVFVQPCKNKHLLEKKMILLSLLLCSLALGTQCSFADVEIHNARKHEFPLLFRSFAGMSVTKRAYEARIVEETGLTALCATCYGDAYICGWTSCKWPCVSAGHSCNVCLKKYECTTNCDKCTGFEA